MTLTIRGNATADEIAAVLVLMSQADQREQSTDGYVRWRSTRLAALRESTGRHDTSRCATIVR